MSYPDGMAAGAIEAFYGDDVEWSTYAQDAFQVLRVLKAAKNDLPYSSSWERGQTFGEPHQGQFFKKGTASVTSTATLRYYTP